MKYINTLYYAILILAIAVSGCNVECIEGSGNQVTENRETDDFSKIDIGGSAKLILKQGETQSLKIVADDNIMEYIKTKVKGETLDIELKNNVCDAGPITIYITNPKYTALELSGAVEVISDGQISTKEFELDLSGSSKVDLQMNASELKTESSGSSVITLRGQSGTHDLDLSGSSEVNAFDFVVGRYKVSTSGSSKVRINVLNVLDVSSSGSSDVEYKGRPSNVNNNNSGASALKRVE